VVTEKAAVEEVVAVAPAQSEVIPLVEEKEIQPSLTAKIVEQDK